VLKVKGTHYEVGYAIGQRFASNIKQFVESYPYLRDRLITFYQTTDGKRIVDAFSEINEEYYPGYFEELKGMSNGSEIPLSVLLLLNFRAELQYWVQNNLEKPHKPSELNCADIHVNFPGNVLVGHNEDAAPAIKQNAYLLEIEIPETGENFSAYTYPGVLPGLSFGWNKDLTFSFNFVFPLPVKVGLARSFVNRHVLASSSVSEAISRATPENLAFGFTVNIGDIQNQKSYSVEVSPDMIGVFKVEQNFSHFNEYKLLNIVQKPTLVLVIAKHVQINFPYQKMRKIS